MHIQITETAAPFDGLKLKALGWSFHPLAVLLAFLQKL